MKLATANQLHAGELNIEREGSNIPEMPRNQVKAAMPQSVGQKQSGWQYGFRHPVGYIPQRTLEGFPSGAKIPRRGGAPVHSIKPKAPKMPHRPNASMGPSHSAPRSGHFHTSPSIKKPTSVGRSFKPHLPSSITRPLATTKHSTGGSFKPHFPKLASGGEAQEPPVGAYSKDNTHETKDWFEEKPMKAKGMKLDPKLLKGIPLGKKKVKDGQMVRLPDGSGFFTMTVKNDADGEPYGTMQHIHIDPKPTFHPPSLVKRGKQTHVPVDDVGETDNKWMDVEKRDSKDTQEFRMKRLKRAAPGGAPAQIPARTTLIPEHSGVYLPTSMMSAQKRPWKQRPVNWDKQPKQRVSYARRGCL